jgi:transposase
VAHRLGQELVTDGLWEIVAPLIPPQPERPQGGGTRYVDDPAVLAAIVYVLTTGCARRHLPGDGAPAVRGLDRGRTVAPAAPGGA